MKSTKIKMEVLSLRSFWRWVVEVISQVAHNHKWEFLHTSVLIQEQMRLIINGNSYIPLSWFRNRWDQVTSAYWKKSDQVQFKYTFEFVKNNLNTSWIHLHNCMQIILMSTCLHSNYCIDNRWNWDYNTICAFIFIKYYRLICEWFEIIEWIMSLHITETFASSCMTIKNLLLLSKG